MTNGVCGYVCLCERGGTEENVETIKETLFRLFVSHCSSTGPARSAALRGSRDDQPRKEEVEQANGVQGQSDSIHGLRRSEKHERRVRRVDQAKTDGNQLEHKHPRRLLATTTERQQSTDEQTENQWQDAVAKNTDSLQERSG